MARERRPIDHGTRRGWLAGSALGVAIAVTASTGGILATPAAAAPAAPATPAKGAPAPPAAGPGITTSADGEVTQDAPLPGEATTNDTVLVPGTVKVAPDRSPARVLEPLDTPLDRAKAAGVLGANPDYEPHVVRSGDVNGDGDADLVVSAYLGGPSRSFVATMLGLGDGHFTEPSWSQAVPDSFGSSVPADMALADVDGDGDLDAILSASSSAAGVLTLLKNAGDGTFAAPITTDVVPNPGAIAVGDFGGATDVQIAVQSSTTKLYAVDVDGDGFDVQTPEGVTLQDDRTRFAMVAADVDGDGEDEVYVTAWENGNVGQGLQRVAHLSADTPEVSWVAGVPDRPYRIAFGDFDGDHHLDLAATYQEVVGYSVRYTVGVFALPGRDPDADPFPAPVAVNGDEGNCYATRDSNDLLPADLDGDGDLDLAMLGCNSTNRVVALANDGTGAFDLSAWQATVGEGSEEHVASTPRVPVGFALLDANGDHLPDVAWAGITGDTSYANNVTVILGDADDPGAFQTSQLVDTGADTYPDNYWNSRQAWPVDWDEDGERDLVMIRNTSIVWRKGDGHGRWAAPEVIIDLPTNGAWCALGAGGEIAVRDWDSDGHLDIACKWGNEVGIGWGSGPDAPLTTVDLGQVQGNGYYSGFHGIYAADLDGDGAEEVIVPNPTADGDEGSHLNVWFQTTARHWDPMVWAPMGSGNAIAIGNVDDDPEPEVVTTYDFRRAVAGEGTRVYDPRIVAFSADGHEGFTEQLSGTLPMVQGRDNQDWGLGLGDFDEDGDLDIAQVDVNGYPYYSYRMVIRRNDGHGNFETGSANKFPTSINFSGGSYKAGGVAFTPMDFDGDGHLDLVYGAGSMGVEVIRGRGDATFDSDRTTRFAAGGASATLSFADVDGDRRPDIVGNSDFYLDARGPQLATFVLLNRSVAGADLPGDLAVTDVSAPTTLAAGADASVDVTITNHGGDIGSGATWTDAAWLSTTPELSLVSPLLARTVHHGPLAAGASYTVTLTGQVQSLVDGVQHLIVRADAAGKLHEPDEDDNSASRDVTVTAPVLVPGGAPLTVHVANGDRQLVRIPASAGRTISVTATPASADGIRARMAPDTAPRPGNGTELRPTGAGALIGSAGRATDGSLYLVVEGLSANGTDRSAAAAAATLSASDAAVAIAGSAPSKVSNGGDATLTVTGAGLGGAAFSLVPHGGASGAAMAAKAVRAGAAGTWFVTFAVDDELGPFDLRASVPGDPDPTVAVLPSAVTIEDAQVTPSEDEFEVSLSVPFQMRRHVRDPQGGATEIRPGYLSRFTIRNRTGHDLPAPYVRLEGVGVQAAWPDASGSDGWRVAPAAPPGEVDSLGQQPQVFTMLATVPGGPVDTIPARATITVEFRLYATGAGAYSVQAGVWAGSDQSGELDYGPEASSVAQAFGLPASKAAAVESALDLAFGATTRPTYPGASPSGPWPTPGGYASALGRMAATLDADGRRADSVEDVRATIVDAALSTVDIGAPIAGRLLEDGGSPGVPLTVSARPVDGDGPVLTGTSAPDGRFNLIATPGDADLAAEAYAVAVEGRLLAGVVEVDVDPAHPAAGVDVAIQRGAVASGRIVRSSDGGPIQRAAVLLVPVGIVGAAPVRADSVVGGGWRATGLVVGTYRMLVKATGFATRSRDVVVTAAGAPGTDVALAPGRTLSGTVRFGGSPVAARVSAFRRGPAGPTEEVVASTSAGSDGTYALDGLDDGDVTIVASDAAGDSTQVDRTVGGGGGLDLALAAPVSVEGTVVDDRSGDPVAGADVAVAGGRFGSLPTHATSAGDGSFRVSVAPVAVTFQASADDRTSAPVLLDAATSSGPVVLRLTADRHITGVVRDHDGDPVPGVAVHALGRDSSSLEGTVLSHESDGTTGTDGRFDLAVPALDTYDVTVLDASVVAAVAAGAPDPDVVIEATIAVVRGRVVDRGGDPAGGAVVHLSKAGDAVASTTSADDGSYSFALTGGATYDLWVGSASVGIAHRSVDVPVDGTTSVPDLRGGSASVSLDLSGPSGAVAGTVIVSPVGSGGDTLPPVSLTVAVGDTGHVTIDGIEPGTLNVAASSPGLAAADLEVSAPTAAAIPVVLGPSASYATRIVDAQGDPVVDAEVAVLGTDPAGSGSAGIDAAGVTGEDGSVQIDGLPAGTYDVWVTPLQGTTELVASDVVLTAATPSSRTEAGTSEAPDSTPYGDGDGHALSGHIVGPNGTGMGLVPPTVTVQSAKSPRESATVNVKPDGSFDLAGLAHGPVRITVSKDKHETKTYVFDIPSQAGDIGNLEVGLPLDANDDLKPEVPPPPLPGLWEMFTALFGPKDPEPLDRDPELAVILAARAALNPCPNGNELLAKAKRFASLALSQTDNFNDLLQAKYDEWWNSAYLFTVEALNTAGTLVAAVIPAGKMVKSGIYAFEIIEAEASSEGVLAVLDVLVNSSLPALVGDVVDIINNGIDSQTFEVDGLIQAGKTGFDTVRYVLETIRDQTLKAVAVGGKVAIPGSARLLRALGTTLSSLYGLYDSYKKAMAAWGNLQQGYLTLKSLDTGIEEASKQVGQLTTHAKRLYYRWLAQISGRADCDQPKDLPKIGGGTGNAVDPNEIEGPGGVGTDRWLARPLGLGYEVHFENLGPGTVNPPAGVPLATAPAADVIVTETIPDTFDRSTFAFADVGWGTHSIDVAPGLQSFEADEPITVEVAAPTDADPDATREVDLVVRVSGDFDPGTGEVTWAFRTLDPETGQTPLDPQEGFLPPEPGDETGQGWLRYTVDAAAGDVQGTFLDAKAKIVFDTNDPLDTNTWRNRVGTPGSDVCPDDDTPNGRFVCQAYRVALGREPDAAGRAYWLGRLAKPVSSGGVTRASLAERFLRSSEGRRLVVARLYQELLGRSVDPSGKAFWAGRLGRSGARRDDLRRELLGSAEYLRRAGGTNGDFVAHLYQDVLGRSADASGKAHWVAAIGAGRSRGSVAATFLASNEARRRIVRASYGRFYDRPAVPAEVSYWTTYLSRSRNDEVRFEVTLMAAAEFSAPT